MEFFKTSCEVRPGLPLKGVDRCCFIWTEMHLAGVGGFQTHPRFRAHRVCVWVLPSPEPGRAWQRARDASFPSCVLPLEGGDAGSAKAPGHARGCQSFLGNHRDTPVFPLLSPRLVRPRHRQRAVTGHFSVPRTGEHAVPECPVGSQVTCLECGVHWESDFDCVFSSWDQLWGGVEAGVPICGECLS